MTVTVPPNPNNHNIKGHRKLMCANLCNSMQPYPWSPRLRGINQLSRIGNILRNIIMINHKISAVSSTNKPIAAFSCTPCVQEVHTKAEVVHLTPGLGGKIIQ